MTNTKLEVAIMQLSKCECSDAQYCKSCLKLLKMKRKLQKK